VITVFESTPPMEAATASGPIRRKARSPDLTLLLNLMGQGEAGEKAARLVENECNGIAPRQIRSERPSSVPGAFLFPLLTARRGGGVWCLSELRHRRQKLEAGGSE
jgi:hypothetical protein